MQEFFSFKLTTHTATLLLLKRRLKMCAHTLTIVPLPFWHELNYFFVFCRTFEKLFIIFVQILIKEKVKPPGFE